MGSLHASFPRGCPFLHRAEGPPYGSIKQNSIFPVLALTKNVIDSINEKRPSLEIGDVAAEEKAISKLDRYLRKIDVPDAEKYIAFLPDLQALRSSGVAHRKGAKYDEVSDRFGIKKRT